MMIHGLNYVLLMMKYGISWNSDYNNMIYMEMVIHDMVNNDWFCG